MWGPKAMYIKNIKHILKLVFSSIIQPFDGHDSRRQFLLLLLITAEFLYVNRFSIHKCSVQVSTALNIQMLQHLS